MNSDSSYNVREGGDYMDIMNELPIENGTCSSENIDSTRSAEHLTTIDTVPCNNCCEEMMRNQFKIEVQKTMIDTLSSEVNAIKVELMAQKTLSAQKSATFSDEIRLLKDKIETFEAYSPKNILIKFDKLQNIIGTLLAEKVLFVMSNEKMNQEIKSLTLKSTATPFDLGEKVNRYGDGFSYRTIYISLDHPASFSNQNCNFEITEFSHPREDQPTSAQELQELVAFTGSELDELESWVSFSEGDINSFVSAVSDDFSEYQLATGPAQDSQDKLAVAMDKEVCNEVERPISLSEDHRFRFAIAMSDGCHLKTVGFSCPSVNQQESTSPQEKIILGDSTVNDDTSYDINKHQQKNDDKNEINVLDEIIRLNPIGLLQELCMARRWELPKYEFSEEKLENRHLVNCSVLAYTVTGAGRTKKLAKHKAANIMCHKLNILP